MVVVSQGISDKREIATMSLGDIKALTFDTGGTILDWHTGLRTAFAEVISSFPLVNCCSSCGASGSARLRSAAAAMPLAMMVAMPSDTQPDVAKYCVSAQY